MSIITLSTAAQSSDNNCFQDGEETRLAMKADPAPIFSYAKGIAFSLVVSSLLALTGCNGEGGGVDLGSGQNPDPVAVDFPVAYVKTPLVNPLDPTLAMDPPDARELLTFRVGSDLFVKDRAAPSAPERNVTAAVTLGLGDVRDVEPSYDGTRFVFAMRGPFDENLNDDEQPKWNIWEYDVANDALRRIIVSDITAEAGHDVAPHYLPDGRIVFSSTRQRQAKAILLDEGKPQFDAVDEDRREFALVLHVMNDDGSDIHQISFNQSHDLDPGVLSTGQLMFTRWDNAGARNAMNLYRVNPDGTGLELLYGALSHDTGTAGATIQFLQPRELADGQVMTITMPFAGTQGGGDVTVIDTPQYVENTQPIALNIGILSGPAQVVGTVNDVRNDGSVSPGGRYRSAFPLADGTPRLLVSWSQCRLQDLNLRILPCTSQNLADPNLVEAPPLYGIWLYDPGDRTQQPVVAPEEGIIFSDAVVARPHSPPPVILDQTPGVDVDADFAAQGVGILHIRSVYDVDGVAMVDIPALADPAQTTANQRGARFIRLEKAVALPDRDFLDFSNTAFGRSAQQGMREILGYAPVEPDGSVKIKVPANVPFAISVLDANGRRITARHQNWLQLRPGQEMECQGCHDPQSNLSHGRDEAFDPAYAGSTTTGLPFPNTDPALFADFGETMAEVRARLSCATDCAALSPSVDIIYDDVWTDEVAAGRSRDASFDYSYADLQTAAPATSNCQLNWSAACRILINYETHIHPMWGLPRITLDADGVTILADNTCTSCHNTVDAANAVQVPVAQLDLSDGQSPDQALHFNSYRELLFPDNRQILDQGALVDELIQTGVDPVTGDPIFSTITVNPSMSVGGANASGTFFSRFDAGGSHQGYLSPAELKLIAEWLDIGGQYFNNPFDAPVN